MNTRPRLGVEIARYTILVVLALFFLLPFYVVVRNAFADSASITAASWQWIPKQWDFGAPSRVLANPDVGLPQALLNSAAQSVAQTLLTVFIALLAGFALARLDNALGRVLTGLTIFTLMVPAAVTFIPTFVMTAQFGWIDSLRGLIIPTVFSAFSVYMFRQSFLTFPVELEDASLIDGCNPFTGFWRVVVPNSLGIIAAVSTITFIGAWNAFLWPLMISRSQSVTVQLALSQYMTSQQMQYPELFAGALIAIVPVVLVFLVLQRFLVQGTEASGIR